MASTTLPSDQHDQLTSFGFFQDADEQHHSPFALNAILNRVKPRRASPSDTRNLTHARKISLTPSTSALSTLDESSEYPASQHPRTSPELRTGTADFAHRSSEAAQKQARHVSPTRSRTADSASCASHRPHVEDAIAGQKGAAAAAATATASASNGAPSFGPSSSSGAGQGNGQGNAASRTRSRAHPRLPVTLRTVAPASTISFTTSAHAVTHGSIGHAASSVDDLDSVAADDGDLDGDASRDQLGSLHSRAIDRSHWAAHGWSAIPGFPLSKDILADDARSVHSSSSRFPRSDTLEELHVASTPSRTGFQTSADAIIRRMRGEGLSKKFWMADENAKECRECLTVFTPFRRKHHCRICGQIFCGRCAAHIIKGHRFGYDGLVRVCNFCMRTLEEYNRRDDAHRPLAGPIASSNSASGFAADAALHSVSRSKGLRNGPHPALRDKQLISAPLEAQVQSPQSQFAANNLFTSATAMPAVFSVGSHQPNAHDFDHTLRSFGLETVPPSVQASPTRPAKARQEPALGGNATTAAPFRKALADDEMTVGPSADEASSGLIDRVVSLPPQGAGSKADPAAGGLSGQNLPAAAAPDRIAFPSTARVAGLGAHVIDGSVGSATQAIVQTTDTPRLRLISDAASKRPAYRTRLRSRAALPLEPVPSSDAAAATVASSSATGSPGLGGEKSDGSVDGAFAAPTAVSSDSGREPPRVSLPNVTPALLAASISMHALHHLTTMMEQTLIRQRVPHARAWLDVLLPVVLTAVSKVRPNPRESSSMDVRHFIKIKRIPGGKATECEYVHGFVCSKNVATKQMAKSLPLTNARVMVVRFPLDYHRGPNQFMSLEPLMAQEHEFIRILVARIVALRPQLVVVEKTVSRLALDLLERAGVVVVWSLKPSAIEAISRCTQADIITSIDRLALDPKLGRCHSFRVETFEHASFPELRKSFMRFEGTPKDLGCTIVLRGANGEMLSRIKRILELMIFVAYNLRLEEHVMRDEGAAMETIHFQRPDEERAGNSWDRSAPGRASDLADPSLSTFSLEALEAEHGVRGDAEGLAILAATQRIDRALRLYSDTLVNSSACIRLPPPYPISRLKEENDLLLQLKRRAEAEELERILKDEGKLQETANGNAAPSATSSGTIADAEEGEATPTATVPSTAEADKESTRAACASADLGDRSGPFRGMDGVQPHTSGATGELDVASLKTGTIEAGEATKGAAQKVQGPPDLASAATSSVDFGTSESAPTTPGPASFLVQPDMPVSSISELPTRTASPAAPASMLSSTVSGGSRSTFVASTLASQPGNAHTFNSELLASLRAPSDVAKEFEYGIVKQRHAAMLRRWTEYLEIPSTGLSPFDHQRLCMLTTTMCAVTQRPCDEPRLVTVDFYGANDETLGHHLEELARSSSRSCSAKNCGRANVVHYRSYVHAGVRVQVVLERFVCPIPGEENRLLSWSYCKVCENATPVAIVTPESWSFSFAKYLELYFYRHDGCRTKLCDHDFCRDQVRYFAYQNLAIRFHSEDVELYEVAVPPTRLFICPSMQSNIKNEESILFSRKNSAYWDSVLARIKALSADACSDASSAANRERNRLLLNEYIKKCEADRREVEREIVRTYRDSAPTDVLCLNRVQRSLQEKVVKWDLDFIEFEKSLIPTERDIRRITTSHLKRLFAEKDNTTDKSSSPDPAMAAAGQGPLATAAELDESAADTDEQERAAAATAAAASAEETSSALLAAVTEPSEAPANAPTHESVQAKRPDDALTISSISDVVPESAPASPVSPISLIDRSRFGMPSQADGNSTDATVDLSPAESRTDQSSALLPRHQQRRQTTSAAAPASPTFLASPHSRTGLSRSSNFSRADESSCTENELARSVTNLVRRFDGPRRPAAMHTSSAGAHVSRLGGEVRRPSMRRGKTEEALSSQSRTVKGGAAGAVAGAPSHLGPSAAKTPHGSDKGEEASSRAASPLGQGGSGGGGAGQASQSRVPRIKRGYSSASVPGFAQTSGQTTPTGSGAGPPSSFRPPRGEGLKAGPRPIIGRTSASMAAKQRGPDGDRAVHASGRQDASGTAASGRGSAYYGGGGGAGSGDGGGGGGIGSRVPVPRRGENGPGTRSRVSTIAKHFDRISREAERERERQHRLLLAQRAKRARPVAMTRAKVEVFSSIKEAVRDDESDHDTAESGDDGASAADNEDEGEDDLDGDGDDADHDALANRKRGLGSAASSYDRRGAIGPSGKGQPQPPSSRASTEGHSGPSAALGSNQDPLEPSSAHDLPLSHRGRREDSQMTIKASSTADPSASGARTGDTLGGGEGEGDGRCAGDVTPDNAVARRQLGQLAAAAMTPSTLAAATAAAGSELESDAPSLAPSTLAGSSSQISSTLPSYLRNGGFADSDSTISLERSFLKTLSGFWAFRTGEMVPLEYPMLNSEHVFGDSEIIFREDEPSSIIAFTLSSRQYNDRLRTLQAEGTRVRETREETFMPGSADEGGGEREHGGGDQPGRTDGTGARDDDDDGGWRVIEVEGAALESVLQKEGTHFRCEFESGSTRLWCKILFAEQFDALRRSCSCEDSFVESLSRCVKWDSSGGKSGSAFLKTRDDRLVVKQLSRFEMDAFSKFAPQYFGYMAQCFGRGRRSTLAKIFGCFRIGFRNPQTGRSLKMDCLVMENLFYQRDVARIYDLKGSMRNRHIQETGRANEVLLDENLVEVAHQSPLFVREHSKRLLRSALYNDSLFLADVNVMDYSLVVGVDRRRGELVVGIIDFVRTFTWDKRVESFVKETALLGGAGKGEPTIITPRQYRTRFLTFLDKSFLLTPDFWIQPGWTQ
ncbi:uncharacterized protein PFL1_03288 [Pseudozyma flocculosa PF-1]|uniref:1-phosphatidylinositol-3-phosphate 5-kinase n=1 Tax=Pseudozyma flocculosa PF-1 TaxID=1277687 RepID=A0A061H8S7_9BASI|nr:uncharacterized protein PFL1_03288 [Pseudozyma flocculosa PF-1]EPQ28998.1 hypothetical protein PFL1_03288 [Pseudozyma flocculosa PF-1]